MRLIDANWVKGKLLNVIRTVTDDMRDAVVYGDDEIYVACENQKSAYTTSITLLDHAPTIEAVPVVHGEWVLLDECSNAGVYCSVCHKKVYRKDYANQKVKSKWCPNCGAKMEGGAE